jgi:hypothetical protein
MKTDHPHLNVKGFSISPELFSLGYPEGGGPCSCTSTCCGDGVYADVTERDRILAHQNMIAKYMDASQNANPSAWFEAGEEEDPDFESGRCVPTSILNDKCAFLDGTGRCSLQVAASGEGMHRWALKPLYCILYPIETTEGTVGFDSLLQDEQACCTISNVYQIPVFQACKDELTRLLGEDGFNALQHHYRTHYQPSLEKTTP